MDGQEMRRIRHKHGLTKHQWGLLMGYTGNENTNSSLVKRYEQGRRPIPLYIARLVFLLDQYPAGALPTFPDWPGYEYESVPDQQESEAHD